MKDHDQLVQNSRITAERVTLAVVTTGLVITAFDRFGSRSNRERGRAMLSAVDFIAEIVLLAVFAGLVFRALNRPRRVGPTRGVWMWVSVGVIGALAGVAVVTLRIERSISRTPELLRQPLTAAQSAERLTPASARRQRMKGLGKTGWAAEVEVELLTEGEAQEDWWSQYQDQGRMTPIIVEVDAAGNALMNDQSYTPDQLREWFANVVATFGFGDPVILRPKPATPLAALDRTAAAALDSGMTRVHLLADGQLQRAYSVRLHGTSVRITRNVEPDSPK